MKKKLVKDKINLQNKARSDFSYAYTAPKEDEKTSRKKIKTVDIKTSINNNNNQSYDFGNFSNTNT